MPVPTPETNPELYSGGVYADGQYYRDFGYAGSRNKTGIFNYSGLNPADVPILKAEEKAAAQNCYWVLWCACWRAV